MARKRRVTLEQLSEVKDPDSVLIVPSIEPASKPTEPLLPPAPDPIHQRAFLGRRRGRG